MLGNLRFVPPILLATILLIPVSAQQQRQDSSQQAAQPDRLLYDRAVSDIQKSHFATARLTLGTLINSYPASKLLPQADLLIAESWYREGGARGLANAEKAYNEFLLRHPNAPEATVARGMLEKIREASIPAK